MKTNFLALVLVLVTSPIFAVAPSAKQRANVQKFIAEKGIDCDILDWSPLMVDTKLKVRAVKIEYKYKPVFDGQEIVETHEEVFYLDSADKVLGTPTTRPDITKKFSQTAKGKPQVGRPVAQDDGSGSVVVSDPFGQNAPGPRMPDDEPPLKVGLKPNPKPQPKNGNQPALGKGKVADALRKNITLSFPRDTLEKSIEMLSEQTGLEIQILGGDLQLEGITKNQSFGLDEINKPAGEVLQTILKLANPDGKLTYVVRGDSIVITTKAAAQIRGDKVGG